MQPWVCWKVAADTAARFVRSADSDTAAEALLADLVWSVLDRQLAERPLTDWLNPAGDRDPAAEPPQAAIMAAVTRECQQRACERIGLDVLDVQLLRFSRPERIKNDLIRLMQADRRRETERRAQALETQRTQLSVQAGAQADRLIADADRQARRIRIDGQRQSQQIEADARRLDPDLTDYLIELDRCRLMIEKRLPDSQPALLELLTRPLRPPGSMPAASRPAASAPNP